MRLIIVCLAPSCIQAVVASSLLQRQNVTDGELKSLKDETIWGNASLSETTCDSTFSDDQKDWQDAVEKGKRLWYQLQSGCYPDKFNAPSISSLKNEGWKVSPWPPKAMRYRQLQRDMPSAPMADIGISSGLDYYDQSVSFKDTFVVEVCSPKNQMIAAVSSRRDPKWKYFWSDIAFAMWLTINARDSSSPSSLKFILRSKIANCRTQSIIGQIQQMEEPTLDSLDLHPVGYTAEWFFAVLGTPNGAGTLYLLMEHKRVLEIKTFDKITVFFATITPSPHLLFHVKNFHPGQVLSSRDDMASNETFLPNCQSNPLLSTPVSVETE